MEDSEPTEPTDNPLAALQLTGTELFYFVLCPRKHWWYTHGMEQEHVGGASSSDGQENVALGTLLHEESYARKPHKEAMIDNLLRIDFADDGAIHEVKKSKGGSRAYAATRMQILYYLYYLKREKGVVKEGMIDYPKQRRREAITLTPDDEDAVAQTLIQIELARAAPRPAVHPGTDGHLQEVRL
jgi:CRISPR-associated exonuclease Cas4